MHSTERQGGVDGAQVGRNLFRALFFNHNFIDLGFQGPKFTWNRGQLFQGLDRSFCNDFWQDFAPRTIVRHLYKLKSDHRPLLVSTNPGKDPRGTRPFRFLASWLQHPEFQDVLSKNGIPNGDVVQNIENFSSKVQEWNRTVFGNIFVRKRRALKELERVQMALERR